VSAAGPSNAKRRDLNGGGGRLAADAVAGDCLGGLGGSALRGIAAHALLRCKHISVLRLSLFYSFIALLYLLQGRRRVATARQTRCSCWPYAAPLRSAKRTLKALAWLAEGTAAARWRVRRTCHSEEHWLLAVHTLRACERPGNCSAARGTTQRRARGGGRTELSPLFLLLTKLLPIYHSVVSPSLWHCLPSIPSRYAMPPIPTQFPLRFSCL